MELSKQAWIAIAIFLAAYGAIISEKLDRTKIALIGASLVILLKVLPQHEAIAAARGRHRPVSPKERRAFCNNE